MSEAEGEVEIPEESFFHSFKAPKGGHSYIWVDLKSSENERLFLFDTGADVSIMPTHVWKTISKSGRSELMPHGLTIRAGNATKVQCDGVSIVKFRLGVVDFKHHFYICPAATTPLLGLDLHEKFDLHLWPGKRMLYKGWDPLCPAYRADDYMNKRKIYAMQNYHVAPRAETVIQARVKCKSNSQDEKICMVEKTNTCLDRTGALVCRTSVVPHESIIPIRIMNVHDEPIRIWKGTVMGLLEPVTEVRNLDTVPAEEEECTCTCAGECSDEGAQSSEYPACCHMFETTKSLEEKYEQVTISQFMTSGASFQKFEADESIPEHVKELYFTSLAALENADQRSRLAEMLRNYADCFAVNSDDIGRTDLVKHEIDTGDAKPVHQRCRRFCKAHIKVIRDTIAKQHASGIIRPSNSNWASNPVIVKKKTGEYRVCIDYRGLNGVTVNPDSYMLPRIDDTLDALAGAKFFCTLDLTQGYHQVELEEGSKHKTAFHAPYCNPSQWEYNYMPFGLVKAPRTFQRLMDKVIQGLEYETALCYIDDIIVFGPTINSVLDRMTVVLERLRAAKLKLKAKNVFYSRRKLYTYVT